MHPDIFNSDIFKLMSLTATVNNQPMVPGRLGQLGYFEEQGVATTSISVEVKGGKLNLVTNQPRGSTGDNVDRETRKVVPFNMLHLPKHDNVMADEVQNIRAFGSDNQLEAVQQVINTKLDHMRRDIDATMEYHRVGAIQGKVMDADGTTVLHDMHDAFGITKATHTVAFGGTDFDLRNRSRALRKISKTALGNVMTSGYRAFCGANFFDTLIADEETKKAWERYNNGEALRNDPKGGFLYGDIFWEEYPDEINGTPLIADDSAFLVPQGVPGLFITRFAPADYMDTVNTIGLPYYSDSQPLGRKGVKLEVQSNPINLCTVPGAVLELTL